MAELEKERNEETVEETVETAEEVAEVNPFEEKYNAEHDAHLRLAAEYDLRIANVKASVAWDYIIQAKELTENLLNASNAALDFINQQK